VARYETAPHHVLWWKDRSPKVRDLAIIALLAGQWPGSTRKQQAEGALATRPTVMDVVGAEENTIRALLSAYSAAFDQPFRAHPIRIPRIRSGKRSEATSAGPVETLPRKQRPRGMSLALGTFALTREVNVVDLAGELDSRSFFDTERAPLRERIIFLIAL